MKMKCLISMRANAPLRKWSGTECYKFTKSMSVENIYIYRTYIDNCIHTCYCCLHVYMLFLLKRAVIAVAHAQQVLTVCGFWVSAERFVIFVFWVFCCCSICVTVTQFLCEVVCVSTCWLLAENESGKTPINCTLVHTYIYLCTYVCRHYCLHCKSEQLF